MLLDEMAPIQTKSIVKRQRPKWVDEEFNQSKIQRRKLERIWRKNRTEENHQKYVQQRKQCADLSISKQKDYYSKLVDGSSGNQRSLFKVVEEMLDRKSERVLPEHTDPVELANEFNRYYVKKIEKLRETIPKDVNIQGVPRKKFEGERLYEFAPTSEEEVLKMVKKYGVKASAEDPLPTEVLKVVVKDLLPLFTSLVNRSFSEGTMEYKAFSYRPFIEKSRSRQKSTRTFDL